MAVITLQSKNSCVLLNDNFLEPGDEALFQTAEEQNHGTNQLGRGTAYFFTYRHRGMVLRHYRRGGLFRHFLRNQYLFAGWGNTRMWREFQMLLALAEQGFPVATPLAARCVKTSPFTYSGSLVTAVIENSQTLATYLTHSPLETEAWSRLGSLLARFHKAGADHADLNANNILLNPQGQFYIIDLDKGVMRRYPGTWQRSNLSRLKRSLQKLDRVGDEPLHFHENHWQTLINAYSKSL